MREEDKDSWEEAPSKHPTDFKASEEAPAPMEWSFNTAAAQQGLKLSQHRSRGPASVCSVGGIGGRAGAAEEITSFPQQMGHLGALWEALDRREMEK